MPPPLIPPLVRPLTLPCLGVGRFDVVIPYSTPIITIYGRITLDSTPLGVGRFDVVIPCLNRLHPRRQR